MMEHRQCAKEREHPGATSWTPELDASDLERRSAWGSRCGGYIGVAKLPSLAAQATLALRRRLVLVRPVPGSASLESSRFWAAAG